MDLQDLQQGNVLIVGLGVTGMSVARFLARHHIDFDVADQAMAEASNETREAIQELAPGTSFYSAFDGDTFAAYSTIVLSPGVPRSVPAIQTALKRNTRVIGDIELFAWVVEEPVIAVTGSNGKSTVVAWIESALRSAGINALACGNIGQPALDSLLENPDVFVLELSSYQLESTRSLKALAAGVLNISDDHLDRYDSIDHYASVKRMLLQQAQFRVVNRDDERTWPDKNAEQGVEYFSLALDGSSATRWHRMIRDDEVWLCDEHFAIVRQSELLLPGDHNAANALAVLALIDPLGIPFAALSDGLTGFRGLPHRSQLIAEVNGIRWYNDSKGTNIDACRKAVAAMPGPVVLIAGGMAKGADFEPLRPLIQEKVKLLVLIGRDREQIAKELHGTTRIEFVDTMQAAVALCLSKAVPGDVVLLSPACSSFDMFRNFEERGEVFSDAVREALAA